MKVTPYNLIIPKGMQKHPLVVTTMIMLRQPFPHSKAQRSDGAILKCPLDGYAPPTTPSPGKPVIWMPTLIKWPSLIPGKKGALFWRTQLAFKCMLCGVIWGPRGRDYTGFEDRRDDYHRPGPNSLTLLAVVRHDIAPNLQN